MFLDYINKTDIEIRIIKNYTENRLVSFLNKIQNEWFIHVTRYVTL